MTYQSLILCLVLTGCSSYSSNFDCPYGEGVGCASVSKVNKMLDHNLIETEDRSLPSKPKQRQIHIYYGPQKMDKIITLKDPIEI
ncbi:hypothetical protein [Candidatus Odyssella thessalonicensis]|uniref:hypothetical protein n=1 Tax=Candidatus Odyssella thessalonicensis TaxID=84647 RepID=UPI000225B985|nr:hypothetical protein [Candidatus Odyssella thessalonicensis]